MNKTYEIISYKHNGYLHRIWQYITFLRETEDYIVLVNDCSNVIDGDGRKWKTKEPAICYFYKKRFYNVIAMLKNNSIVYYCNLSSPYVWDSEGIKYIDYDLDVKVFPTKDKVILDRDEFEFNKIDYHYDEKLINIIERQLKDLIKIIEIEDVPFDKVTVFNDYKLYLLNKGK